MHIWGMRAEPGCRSREGGWESWAAPGGKKEAEQCQSFSPSGRLFGHSLEEDAI